MGHVCGVTPIIHHTHLCECQLPPPLSDPYRHSCTPPDGLSLPLLQGSLTHKLLPPALMPVVHPPCRRCARSATRDGRGRPVGSIMPSSPPLHGEGCTATPRQVVRPPGVPGGMMHVCIKQLEQRGGEVSDSLALLGLIFAGNRATRLHGMMMAGDAAAIQVRSKQP